MQKKMKIIPLTMQTSFVNQKNLKNSYHDEMIHKYIDR